MDPRNGGDLLCSQEGVYSVPRRGRREGGAGYGCCPIEVGAYCGLGGDHAGDWSQRRAETLGSMANSGS